MNIQDFLPDFSSVPRIILVKNPTPIFRANKISSLLKAEVWVKEDGMTNQIYGGNKPRKLEFLLGEAKQRKYEKLVTSGGTGTHHGIASTIFGKGEGFKVSLHLFRQYQTPHSEKNFKFLKKNADEIHLYNSPLRAFLGAFVQCKREKKSYYIPPGGSNSLSDLGYVIAVFELKKQIDEGIAPDFDAIFVPGGSLGTGTGIIAGSSLLGSKWQIIVVRVVDLFAVNKLMLKIRLMITKNFLKTLGARKFFPVKWKIDHSEFGEEYGKPTEECKRAVEIFSEEGIKLEETYTGKTAASLIKWVKEKNLEGKKILFWKTNSSFSPY